MGCAMVCAVEKQGSILIVAPSQTYADKSLDSP